MQVGALKYCLGHLCIYTSLYILTNSEYEYILEKYLCQSLDPKIQRIGLCVINPLSNITR